MGQAGVGARDSYASKKVEVQDHNNNETKNCLSSIDEHDARRTV